ncbi:MAG: hypothetical protein L0Z53_26300 [Acidobacteriales bacterium]|nr:hypothetical protein [Terriglobales bacterium]
MNGFYRVNGKLLCEPCADKAVTDLQASSQPLQVTQEIDRTVCSKCQMDYGRTELPLVGGLPFCENCRQGLYNRGFPAWLTASLAGLLVLLGLALWHGIPYFHAERSLVLGERAIAEKKYAEATVHLENVLKVAPKGQKAVLLATKAYLLADDIQKAQAALQHRQTFEQDALFREVNAFWNRAVDAYENAAKASKLLEAKKYEEAAKLMSTASAQYPESLNLAVAADFYAGGAAFERKDYDSFVTFSRAAMKKTPEDPQVVAGVASALACKYAVTGNPEFRNSAEELLEKAKVLSHDAESKADYEEYAERIRHRLDTREIIEKQEYDRRYRKAQAKAEEKS